MQNDMRDRVIELLEQAEGQVNNDVPPLEMIANYLITNNVVSIVRCANCRYRKKGVFRAVDNLVYWQCKKHNVEILLTDFCSYGEKEDKKNA